MPQAACWSMAGLACARQRGGQCQSTSCNRNACACMSVLTEAAFCLQLRACRSCGLQCSHKLSPRTPDEHWQPGARAHEAVQDCSLLCVCGDSRLPAQAARGQGTWVTCLVARRLRLSTSSASTSSGATTWAEPHACTQHGLSSCACFHASQQPKVMFHMNDCLRSTGHPGGQSCKPCLWSLLPDRL